MTRTKPLLLVVDDDVPIAQALSSELAAAGYDTAIAHDGVEGHETFERIEPDLVLTDLAMPRCDGFALIAGVRKSGDTPVLVPRGGKAGQSRADLGSRPEGGAGHLTGYSEGPRRRAPAQGGARPVEPHLHRDGALVRLPVRRRADQVGEPRQDPLFPAAFLARASTYDVSRISPTGG